MSERVEKQAGTIVSKSYSVCLSTEQWKATKGFKERFAPGESVSTGMETRLDRGKLTWRLFAQFQAADHGGLE